MKHGQTHGGKGSAQRPTEDADKFASNWDAIFSKGRVNDCTDEDVEKDKTKQKEEDKK